MKKYATKGSHEGEQQQYTQYTFLLYSSRAHTFPDVYFYINNRCPSILQYPPTSPYSFSEIDSNNSFFILF